MKQLALLAALFAASACKKSLSPDQALDVASATVKKYAYEAYPSWAQSNPDKTCPTKLAELNEFMNAKDIRDPWGTDYRLFCGDKMPAGSKGLAVQSAGADRQFDTADDIKSW